MEEYYLELINGEIIIPEKGKVHFYNLPSGGSTSSFKYMVTNDLSKYHSIGLTTEFGVGDKIYRVIPFKNILSIGLLDSNKLKELLRNNKIKEIIE